MRLKENSTSQKLRGAYYTPPQLSDAMVGLFAFDNNIQTVLEPSCGDGVFLDSLLNKKIFDRVESLTAIEIEADEIAKVDNRFGNNIKVETVNADFFDYYKKFYKQKHYDLILGNPPYIRYQYLTDSQRKIQSQILVSHGMKANKLINAWVGFLVACTQMLTNSGRIAFVVPAEILQVAYAEDLRLFLSEQFSRITLITFEKLVFPEAEQEVLVFIGEKGGEEKGIRIIELDTLDDFELLDLNKNGYQKLQHVKEKWTKYFVSSEEIKVIEQVRTDSRFANFADFGLINVGITTGNNSYFSIDKSIEKKYELQDVTLPLVGRSAHTRGIYFTENDWQANVASGKKAMLVHFPDISYDDYPATHKRYIQEGETSKQHEGYKCSIRDRWYIVPSIWVPDAFFLRRNNLYPKFVLNKCGAVSTDTMHRMKFKEGIDHDNVLLSYYNSVSFAFTEICGRSYGGGVLEILPREMGKIVLPKIHGINEDLKRRLLDRIDTVIRQNQDIEIALDMMDKELLVEVLGIEQELCNKCRAVWRKLQNRRLGRG